MTNPTPTPASFRPDLVPDGPRDGVRGASDDRRDGTAPTGSDEGAGYSPPEKPEDHHWFALGLKMALAMLVADVVARRCGFESPTWSVITAAYLAAEPPVGSVKSALSKLLALAVGIALGAAGAYAAELLSGVPALHFALVGLVAGAIASRSSDYLFAAVVGTIVTFVGTGGGDPLPEVVVTTACMVLIGCIVGPTVVWAVERARRFLAERRS